MDNISNEIKQLIESGEKVFIVTASVEGSHESKEKFIRESMPFFDIDKELEHFFQGNSQTESHETFQTTLSKFCNELELRLSSTCGRIKI